MKIKRSFLYFFSIRQDSFFYFSILFYLFFSCLGVSCNSYKQFRHMTESFEIPSKIFNTSYHNGWIATLEVIKKYDLELTNQEAGIVKTRWMDNTAEINFNESFGSINSIKAAKFKVILNVVKGFRNGQEVTKVTVYKRQLVEKNFLQGWEVLPSDGITEKVLLYRIARTIHIGKRIHAIEEKKSKKVELNF